MKPHLQAHLDDAPAILQALQTSDSATGRAPDRARALLGISGLKGYQRFLLAHFEGIIGLPSFEYISKTPESWLVVGDRRPALAAGFQVIAERHGIGVTMLVLHLQQLVAGHIPLRVRLDGREVDLARPTQALHGSRGEHVLWIPVRSLRNDMDHLAALHIVKPRRLLNRARTVSHERDGASCFFCSCPEMNPAEVVVELDGPRFGLSRSYRLGFTFAPFGHPVRVVHFLAWDSAPQPLSMSLAPGTVADLVRLTRLINKSIRNFFAGTGITDYPVLDGLSNGWAGNTIFHAHFQFFAPEFDLPLESLGHVERRPLGSPDHATVARLNWPLPAYRIHTSDPLNTALIGQELAALWRFLGRDRRVPYKHLPPGTLLTPEDLIPAHTQNLYVPGAHGGRVLHLALRDRGKVDYEPAPGTWVNPAARISAQPKKNLGVLEATGTWIVDDAAGFTTMTPWAATDLTEQIRAMTAAVAPSQASVDAFEHEASESLPQ